MCETSNFQEKLQRRIGKAVAGRRWRFRGWRGAHFLVCDDRICFRLKVSVVLFFIFSQLNSFEEGNGVGSGIGTCLPPSQYLYCCFFFTKVIACVYSVSAVSTQCWCWHCYLAQKLPPPPPPASSSSKFFVTCWSMPSAGNRWIGFSSRRFFCCFTKSLEICVGGTMLL